MTDNTGNVDVLVRTFNSGRTLRRCLESINKNIKYSRILIADRNSTDETISISREFDCMIMQEDCGIGKATNLLIANSSTENVLFVDSDVIVLRDDFLSKSIDLLRKPSTGAVVGLSSRYIFKFGLPLGLTLMRRRDLLRIQIPDWVQGRETYYIQEFLRRNRLKVRYIQGAMIHEGTYRSYRYWPEWQGAAIQATGSHARQLLKATGIVAMMHLNTRSVRNFAYSPIFYYRLLRGFFNPEKFGYADRRKISETDFPGAQVGLEVKK